MAFTRYSLEGEGNSLYFIQDGEAFPEAVVVASECLYEDEKWRRVPDRHMLLVGSEGNVSLRPL